MPNSWLNIILQGLGACYVQMKLGWKKPSNNSAFCAAQQLQSSRHWIKASFVMQFFAIFRLTLA
jgi:hypothetical protein